MNRWNKITCIALVALLLAGGAASLLLAPPDRLIDGMRQPRQPAPFGLDTLGTGEFTRSLENAYADRFPGRELWMDLRKRYDRALQQFSGQELFKPGDENIDPNDIGTRNGGYLIANDRTGAPRIMFSYDRDQDYANIFADGVNALGRELRGRGWVGLMQIPGSFGVYAADRHINDQNDQAAQIAEVAALSGGVEQVDIITPLRDQAAADPGLYFRSDHHWTVYGAHLAYATLCAAWGLEPVPLSQLAHGYYSGFLGSYYLQMVNYPQSEQFERKPDIVDYYLPDTPAKAFAYNDLAMTEGHPVRLVLPADPSGAEGSYGCFTEGDHAVTHITTSLQSGRKLLILKDSYSNALLPFLSMHFDEIVALDYRRFGGEAQEPLSLAAFAREMEATHVLLSVYAKAGHDPLANSVASVLP